MRPLTRIRRLTAVLSGALLLQLSLLASGTLCPMHAGHAGSAHATAQSHAAHTMARPGEHAMASSAGATVTQSPAANVPGVPSGCEGSGTSCNMPWSAAGCLSMGGCAIGTSAPGAVDVEIAFASPLAVHAANRAALPIGPTYAPELPPPRA